jgi:hypothetical protein
MHFSSFQHRITKHFISNVVKHREFLSFHKQYGILKYWRLMYNDNGFKNNRICIHFLSGRRPMEVNVMVLVCSPPCKYVNVCMYPGLLMLASALALYILVGFVL